MPANATTYRSIELNQSGIYYLVVYLDDESSTVFSSSLPELSLQKWLQGQFKVSWDGTSNGGYMFGLPGRCKVHYADVNDNSAPNVQNIVFWNPERSSQLVHLAVYREAAEIDYANLSLSLQITAVGAVGTLAIISFLVVKNRAQLRNYKMTRKKALVVLVATVMFASGVFLAYTFSRPVEGESILSHGSVVVPANDYKAITYQVNAEGTYIIQLTVDQGTIQAFDSGDGTPFMHWGNGSTYDVRTFAPPIFNASSGITGGCYGGEFDSMTEYMLLSNFDGYSKQVQYEVSYHWSYSNNFFMVGGVTLATTGAMLLFLVLLKAKLGEFNRALENQE
jgi:hypothetical protein